MNKALTDSQKTLIKNNLFNFLRETNDHLIDVGTILNLNEHDVALVFHELIVCFYSEKKMQEAYKAFYLLKKFLDQDCMNFYDWYYTYSKLDINDINIVLSDQALKLEDEKKICTNCLDVLQASLV